MKSEVYKNWNDAGTKVQYGDSTYYYFHILINGISDVIEKSVTIYPNPAKDKFTINCESPIKELEIYDLTGKKVYSDYQSKHQDSKEIDLSTSPKGIYIVRINTGTEFYNRKVIIQ